MEYDFQAIEKRWKAQWKETDAYKVIEDPSRKKYYVLDMFPYPSGAGLHVGHPLGYIASDVFARYKRHQGYNVLHPMGYDSFGLPAEQYAIQTGQHPAVTTEANITRYREQLEQLGFCYDWSREVRTSDPAYYRWTQWIFGELFESWYDEELGRARPLKVLIESLDKSGLNGSCQHVTPIGGKTSQKMSRSIGEMNSRGSYRLTSGMHAAKKQKRTSLCNFVLHT